PLAALKRLDGAHDDLGRRIVMLRFDPADTQVRGNLADLIHGLLDQFVTMRQDQGLAAYTLSEMAEDDRLASSRWQHDQQAPESRGTGFLNLLKTRRLIVAKSKWCMIRLSH